MSHRKWGRYERLRPAEVDAMRRETPIAYVPWGALEWHSYHNPIGLDGLKAHALCEAMARETGGVVLPVFYVGTDTIKPFKGFRHTLDYSEEVVAGMVATTLEQVADEGFLVIVLLTGHYGGRHVHVVRQCAEAFQRTHPDVALWAFPDCEVLEGAYPANHAAHGETSFLLLFEPTLVDLTRLPTDRLTTLDDDGVWGDDPREATAAAGAAMLRTFLERTVPRILSLLERSRPGCRRVEES